MTSMKRNLIAWDAVIIAWHSFDCFALKFFQKKNEFHYGKSAESLFNYSKMSVDYIALMDRMKINEEEKR